MKNIVLIFFIVFIFICIGQAVSPNNRPETVYRYIYEQHSREWYVEQARLWESEIERRREDAVAWRNYFMANKYAHWRGNVDIYMSKMDSILSEMGKYIPDSYEYNYLRFYNGERDVSLLEKAYAIDPKRADALYELVLYHENVGDEKKLKKFCKDLYKSMDISPGLLDYNYNVLVSTEKNGILFTNGDNDTYPVWVLQQALGIRQDVMVVNLHMTFTDRKYLKRKLTSRDIDIDVETPSKKRMNYFIEELTEQISEKYSDIPIHVALTVYKGTIREIEEDLYLIGLCFKYSKKRFDNIQSLKDNVYNKLRLDYLSYDWYNEKYLVTSLLDKLHVNYVVVFLKLAENFHESGESAEALKWKNKAHALAKKANNEEFIEHINDLDW
jgi:hypothetical protein